MSSQVELKEGRAARMRQHIMRVAWKQMSEKGYEKTLVRDICSEAGITIGTFYAYFENKDALLAEAEKRGDDIFCSEIASRAKGDTPLALLRNVIRLYANTLTGIGHRIVARIFSINDASGLKDREIFRMLGRILSDAQEAGEITSAHNGMEICWSLYMLMRGCVFNWYSSDGVYDLTKHLMVMTDIFLDAVSTSNPSCDKYDLSLPRPKEIK